MEKPVRIYFIDQQELSHMKDTALQAMKHVMGLRPDDKVLVVTDEATKNIGIAFLEAARGEGCEAEVYLLPEDRRPLTEVPDDLMALLTDRTVALNFFRGMPEETPFRIRLIKEETRIPPLRLGHGPGITEKMMTEGPMNVDFGTMLESAQRLIEAFEGARSAHVTAPGGTDLFLDIEGRGFSTDAFITEDNAGNLPCGEIWCGPVEDGVEGILVVDGSIGDLGPVATPLTMTVEKGRVIRIDGEDSDLVCEVDRLISVDAEARVVGELGIGLNPGARLTGNLLEDEKAFRTAHVAFGNNEDMPGGRNRSKTHRDFLFREPTFEVTFRDGSVRTLIEDGDIRI